MADIVLVWPPRPTALRAIPVFTMAQSGIVLLTVVRYRVEFFLDAKRWELLSSQSE